MMQNSKYTVLMSVYYKEKPEYLSLSIESMLNQTVKPDEFIIVKDGPLTTELDEVINNFVTAYPKTFNIIVNETNLGLGPALAKGIENSKNELIARMDSDDYVVSTRCERQLEKFREDRVLNILNIFKLEKCGLVKGKSANGLNIPKIEWNVVNLLLDNERHRSLDYIDRILK